MQIEASDACMQGRLGGRDARWDGVCKGGPTLRLILASQLHADCSDCEDVVGVTAVHLNKGRAAVLLPHERHDGTITWRKAGGTYRGCNSLITVGFVGALPSVSLEVRGTRQTSREVAMRDAGPLGVPHLRQTEAGWRC